MIEKHIVDPDGDCIFRLRRVSQNSLSENEEIDKENEGAQNLDSNMENSSLRNDNSIPSDDESIAENSNAIPEFQEVEFLVSLKYMMLASPVFKAMFQHARFKEGEELHTAGTVSVALPDDNPDAFLILVNILHCRYAEVPLRINLSDLCDFAILVDKYRMKIISNIWIDTLMHELYTYQAQDVGVLHWLCISWVFDVHEAFRRTTWLLMSKGENCLSTRLKDHVIDLPIPDNVIEAIDTGREDLIAAGFKVMTQMIFEFQTKRFCNARFESSSNGGNTVPYVTEACRNECDSMMLGSLMRDVVAKNLYPPPAPPFNRLSLLILAKKFEAVKFLSPCKKNQPDRGANGTFFPGDCFKYHRLRNEMYKISSECVGLELGDFKSA